MAVSGDKIIDAEYTVVDDSQQSDSSIQSFNELEIERLKTRRAEISAIRTKGIVDSITLVVVLAIAFASCTMMCAPWAG